MPHTHYQKVRKQLQEMCARYGHHNQEQLDSLPLPPPLSPVDVKLGNSFYLGGDPFRELPGFIGWASCRYTQLLDAIFRLDSQRSDSYWYSFMYYAKLYPHCQNKSQFFPLEAIAAPHEFLSLDLLIDRLELLAGLLTYLMVNRNHELVFEERFKNYDMQNNTSLPWLDADSRAIRAYKTLGHLQTMVNFVTTLPRYSTISLDLLYHFNTSLSGFEGYIKGAAVQELNMTLDNKALDDKTALKTIAAQLNNKSLIKILEKNRQSDTEYILKVMSVALIPLGIGLLPTFCLAAKRLYDTQGASMNFFKPLSQHLSEEITDLTTMMFCN